MLSQVNHPAAEWAKSHAAALIDGLDQTTADRVKALVAQAIEEGWSNDDLADALADDSAFDDARAEVIARTETAAADVQGSLIGWKASGVVSGKEWIVGAGCCEECDALDKEVVGIDEEFPDGDPPLHPNCRCNVSPVLDDGEADE